MNFSQRSPFQSTSNGWDQFLLQSPVFFFTLRSLYTPYFFFAHISLWGWKENWSWLLASHISWTQLIHWFYKAWEYLIPSFLLCKTSSLCFVLYEYMLAILSSNESLPSATDKETADGFVLTNDSSLLSYYDVTVAVVFIIHPLYNKQSKESILRLVIALFAALIGILSKVISRISVHRLGRITHPGYSCVLLAPLYCASTIMFRVLQADLDSLQSMAVLGFIHGAAEVIERSTMVVIDHICHVICKRITVPWGSFRTPRREKLMADIAVMSMLFESSVIVSFNGLMYLYQYIYLKEDSLLELLQSFAITDTTSVQLTIERFFAIRI